MKKLVLALAGLGMATAAVPASAQPWQGINARQAQLEQRIDRGIRTGALTRREAETLRADFRGLARLEARYRASRPGLTQAERRDLDRSFDRLAASIRAQKNDRQARNHR